MGATRPGAVSRGALVAVLALLASTKSAAVPLQQTWLPLAERPRLLSNPSLPTPVYVIVSSNKISSLNAVQGTYNVSTSLGPAPRALTLSTSLSPPTSSLTLTYQTSARSFVLAVPRRSMPMSTSPTATTASTRLRALRTARASASQRMRGCSTRRLRS